MSSWNSCTFMKRSLYFQHVSATAAAAKSLQSCPTLCDPIDGSPPGSPVPEILQARTLEWVAISFSSAWKWKVKVKSLSRIRLLATPWTSAYQAPPSMGFSRQSTGVGCHCLLCTSRAAMLKGTDFLFSSLNMWRHFPASLLHLCLNLPIREIQFLWETRIQAVKNIYIHQLHWFKNTVWGWRVSATKLCDNGCYDAAY